MFKDDDEDFDLENFDGIDLSPDKETDIIHDKKGQEIYFWTTKCTLDKELCSCYNAKNYLNIMMQFNDTMAVTQISIN